jgi:hypothetical protein
MPLKACCTHTKHFNCRPRLSKVVWPGTMCGTPQELEATPSPGCLDCEPQRHTTQALAPYHRHSSLCCASHFWWCTLVVEPYACRMHMACPFHLPEQMLAPAGAPAPPLAMALGCAAGPQTWGAPSWTAARVSVGAGTHLAASLSRPR